MSTETVTKAEIVSKHSDTLDPIPAAGRNINFVEYALMWLAGCVFLGYFMLGASLIPPVGQLNLFQAFMAMGVAMIIVALFFTLNGMPGHKYGIPMVVQLRSSFGYTGSKIPALIRPIPAICWYGIQTWIGALAINGISQVLTGYENVPLFFALFLLFQIALSVMGFQSIKWVEIIGAVFIVIAFIWMAAALITTFGVQLQQQVINIPGTWGRPFWVGVMAFVAIYTTLMLNVGDYTRYVKKSVTRPGLFWAHLLGCLPATVFMAGIGVIAAGATGEWNPIDVLVHHMPSTTVLVISLFFIVIAQFTTNLMLNVVPAANVFMEIFKWKWQPAAILSGLLVLLTFPWRLATAEGFFLYMQVYSIVLGPILGVMLVDFWVIRRGRLNVNSLYRDDKTFRYGGGFNPAAFIALAAGIILAAIDVEISWYIGFPAAALIYYALMTMWIGKKYPPGDLDVEELTA